MGEIFNFFEFKEVFGENDIGQMRVILQDQRVVVIKNVWEQSFVKSIKNYLSNLGMNSIPNYNPISENCPNFHRLNRSDSRAAVNGCFQQFNFLPWNQDYFELFEKAKFIFYLKNLLSGLPKSAFLFENHQADEHFTARIAFQFYPSGLGYLNKHADPVGQHQFALPNMVMSKKGEDFATGGTYFELNEQRYYQEDTCEVGDVVFFDASLPHGVERIDAVEKGNWLDYKGRWMGLFSVNKFASNNIISSSLDLEK